MKAKIKCLKKKGNKDVVENLPVDSKALVDILVSPEVEWVFSYESPLVKPLLGKDFKLWLFGACAKEIGVVHIFLDNILKAYGINGFEPVEQWFTFESTKHLVHELIHCLAQEWTEEQVERATGKFVDAWLNPIKSTRLVIHIGDRTVEHEHLLIEGNPVLEVKP